jgi:hypothetical protein
MTLLGVMLVWMSSSCSPTSTPQLENGLNGCVIQVDLLFREYYLLLGGKTILGCPLVLAATKGTVTEQYTEGALMQYDPMLPTSQQFSLAPLGKQSGLADSPLAIVDEDNPAVVDGIIIYDKFLTRFTAMGGLAHVGRPITQPIADPENQLITQYFENAAFYTSAVDAKDDVHLVSLGIQACGVECIHPAWQGGSPEKTIFYSEPFLKDVLRLGRDLFGSPVSSYYAIQVYENVILLASLTPPYRISLQPLPSYLGYDSSLPEFQPAARDPSESYIFNQLSDSELGYNEALIFEQYVATHGSKALSGPVTSQLFPVNGIYRQCYSNYCLDYNPQDKSVRPAPLGTQYLKQHLTQLKAGSTRPLVSANTSLRMNVYHEQVTQGESQTIIILTQQSSDWHPLTGAEAVLMVSLPNGTQEEYKMPPTDAGGRSSITLDPIQAESGTLIGYQVCMKNTKAAPICAKDTYLIWNH